MAFSIIEAKNIAPFRLQGYAIISRQVRLGLFDKNSIVGNVHVIEAMLNPNHEKKWRFSNKASLLFPKDDDNTCFVRTNDIDINLCLLFEISVTVKKIPVEGINI